MSEKHITDRIVAAEELIENAAKGAAETVEPYRKTAFHRFPLLFTLLAAFGVAATFYGFEKIIDDIPFLKDRSVVVLIVGLVVLAITGTLYRKLS